MKLGTQRKDGAKKYGALGALLGCIGVLALFQRSGHAAPADPYVPKDDAVVVERLRTGSTDPRTREIETLRRTLAKNPRDLEMATRLARMDIEESRARSDPRYLGHAQAALAPWWSEPNPPPDVLVLRATIRQSNHDFEGALADIDAVLRVDPNDAQAWITRSVILTVRADYAEARRSCDHVANLSTPLVTSVCRAGIDSMTGAAKQAYAALEGALTEAGNRTPAEEAWAVSTLGEVALRMGNNEAAEKHFTRALTIDPSDAYSLGAYADLLLDLKRYSDVTGRLSEHLESDGLLLRLVIAESALGARDFKEHAETLRARYAASHKRGDTVHRREEARFVLAIERDAPRALTLAKANWEVQRETWDARALLEAAIAAHDKEAAAPVLAWQSKNHNEDPKLLALAAALGP